jgi:hypothetical protein
MRPRVRTDCLPPCMPHPIGQFALARAKAKKVADERGDDPDSVPDIREGGLEV